MHRSFKPRHATHHAARPAAGPLAASASTDCLPVATLPAIAGGLGDTSGGRAPLAVTTPPLANGGPDTGFPFFGGGGADDLSHSGYGGGGFAGGGSGGGGGGGGSPVGGGGTPPGSTPTTPGIPSASNAPEPASWALMVGGFGVLGGAMRYGPRQRRHLLADGPTARSRAPRRA